jgi:hypothetical protein
MSSHGTVVSLRARRGAPSGPPPHQNCPTPPAALERFLLGALVALAGLFALSGFADGLYDLKLWGPVAVIAAIVLVAVSIATRLEGDALSWVALGSLSALMLWSGVSLLWSSARDRGWEDTNRLALYVVVFCVALVAVRSLRSARAALGALAVGIGVVGAYVLVRLIAGDGAGLFVAFRLSEPLGYINGEAAFLGAGAWIWLSAAEGLRSVWARAASLSMAVALVGLVVLTQSRGGSLALCAAALVAVVVFPGRTRRVWTLGTLALAVAAALPWLLDVYAQRKGAAITSSPSTAVMRDAGLALLFAAVAAGAVYAAALALVRRLPERPVRLASALSLTVLAVAAVVALALTLHDPAGRVERSWDQFTSLSSDAGNGQRFTTAGGYRYDYWRIAWRSFTSSPVGGLGAGDYPARYLRERRNPDYVVHAHSLPLQVLAETGLVGGLALAGFLLAIGAAALRLRRSADPGVLQASVAATGVFAGWLVASSVDWVASIPALTGLALICAAVLLRLPRATVERPVRDRGSSAAVLAMLFALLVSASVSVQWLAGRFRSHAQQVVASDPAGAIRSANRSLALDPEALPAYYAKSAGYARLDDYRSARQVLGQATRREPDDFVAWALMGDLAVRAGYFTQARRDYAHASRLNPYEKSLTRLASRPGSDEKSIGR